MVTTVAAVHPVLPSHSYPQAELTEMFAGLCVPDPTRRRVVDRLHASARVATRHLALPIDQYDTTSVTSGIDARRSVRASPSACA